MPHRRLPEPFVFYVDECLGRHVVREAMLGALWEGERIETRPQGTLDEEWLPEAGDRWICLTKDGALRRRPNQLEAIRRAGAAIILLGEASGSDQAQRVVAAMPLLRRVARTQDLAFIARLERDGRVIVMYEAGQQLPSPRSLRAKPSDARADLAKKTDSPEKKRRR